MKPAFKSAVFCPQSIPLTLRPHKDASPRTEDAFSDRQMHFPQWKGNFIFSCFHILFRSRVFDCLLFGQAALAFSKSLFQTRPPEKKIQKEKEENDNFYFPQRMWRGSSRASSCRGAGRYSTKRPGIRRLLKVQRSCAHRVGCAYYNFQLMKGAIVSLFSSRFCGKNWGNFPMRNFIKIHWKLLKRCSCNSTHINISEMVRKFGKSLKSLKSHQTLKNRFL